MLIAQDLTIGHVPKNPLLKDINLQCKTGELILLLGINGIGKSTLLKTICGLIEPLGGVITYNNNDIWGLKGNERAKLISGVFTGRDFDPYITVREFVTLGRYPYTNWLGTLSQTDERLISISIQTLGLSQLADKKVQQLSDGERQKTLIAKALVQDTPIIVMDEPIAFLDYKNKAELLDTIKQLAYQQDKIILLSTHDISSSLSYSSRAFLITESRKFIAIENNNYSEPELKALMEAH